MARASEKGGSRRPARSQPRAGTLPVARVAVDLPLAHLDRPFDYLVPARLAEAAVPGCRVRVRFAGQLTSGYLLERMESSGYPGRLAYLERVVSPEPVLTSEVAALAREVADRYAGTLADVLRLAVPPRHAGAEALATPPPPGLPARPDPGPWRRYPAGVPFLSAIAAGRAPRAVWTALPGPCWPDEIARAAAAAAATGRGALIVVPDAGDLALVDAALAGHLGPGRHICLTAGLGPAERYRRWLAVARGSVRVVAGTRAAAFAPVQALGLVVIWDDGDDLHAERRAPYPHAREVLALRAHRAGAAALIGGFARTAEATSLVERGWAVAVAAGRRVVLSCAPRMQAAGDDTELARDPSARTARIPGLALRAAREGLHRGPVLVQVPRRGYVTAVACGACRRPARCGRCGGPLALAGPGAPAACRWCDHPAPGWRCQACGDGRLRALITGAGRTAEELQRAFPGIQVMIAGAAGAATAVPPLPALVVATPGGEPRTVTGGYAAAVLLDGWVLLGRPSLRAAEESLRRWLNAAALVEPASAGGTVVAVADSRLPTVQALVRWDPVTHAERELAERRELRLPPETRMAAVSGTEPAVTEFMAALSLPAGADVIGPAPLPAPGAAPDARGGPEDAKTGSRFLVRVPRAQAGALAAALQAAQGARSARKDAGPVRVQLDPAELI